MGPRKLRHTIFVIFDLKWRPFLMISIEFQLGRRLILWDLINLASFSNQLAKLS